MARKREEVRRSAKRIDCATKQAQSIPLLAVGVSSKQTAERIGVDHRTISRWMRESEFRASLELATKELIEEAHGRLKCLVTHAIDTLHGGLDAIKSYVDKDGNVTECEDWPSRLKAAKEILDRNVDFAVSSKIEHSGEIVITSEEEKAAALREIETWLEKAKAESNEQKRIESSASEDAKSAEDVREGS